MTDWPLLNALINTASGASLGVDSQRRGVGIGYCNTDPVFPVDSQNDVLISS